MKRLKQGTCTKCGAENVMLTAVDDGAMLCEICLDDLGYLECDECHNFFRTDKTEFYEMENGRTICEDCAAELMNDESLLWC